ncbi:ATP-dependent Clp protease proteolytic subunit [Romeria aff. gracilis LEGE 07310]|uniref:ATP-dependent Clp protease proteolytic subunit n=1 Tax=Vasconcelosia minhoensis LEGE 07310 TaxID=915328 RepID=A0A8J7AVE5_9CYAN|nr:ATP-dependent Clp protease proteolytic subunit [Romeria gracilis]MBE9077658.1 ATP-dependent Clp protease proteolytic subunit [Romeria aff. gracilis LEGE 07310]
MPVDGVLRVPYNLPGSRAWQWVNIFTRMSQERILFLNQPLTDSLANSLVSAMLYLDSDDSTKPIYLYINSIGDPVMAGMADDTVGMMSIMAGLAIYDTLQHIKSELVTICLGQAVGMSAVLLSAGVKGKRAALPHASIALTHPQSLSQGQATDIQLNAQEVLAKQSLVLDILAETTGQPKDRIAKDMERMFYLSPQEAKDYGLIDRVVETPTAIAT